LQRPFLLSVRLTGGGGTPGHEEGNVILCMVVVVAVVKEGLSPLLTQTSLRDIIMQWLSSSLSGIQAALWQKMAEIDAANAGNRKSMPARLTPV
jgi:hypothetical protein